MMKWIESLQQAIDFMEEHLSEDISIEQIAKEVNFSPFHFQRTFSILTDISIGEYLRRRRLTLAAHELQRTEAKVIDVALKYGYDTPEAFTKAFRRQHGITPSEARTYSGKLTSYNRLVIQVNLKGAEPMNVKIVKKEAFQIVGMNRQLSLENGENHKQIPIMWENANKDGTSNELFQLQNGPKGVLGVCVDNNDKTIDYWIASAHEGEVPSHFSKMTIPASTWAIFEVHGAMPDAMTKAWKQIFSEWFPSSGYEHAGTPELEVYSEDDPANPNLYSEIWIPVK